MGVQLYPYQAAQLDASRDFNRVAYYHDMGLGKTFTGAEKAVSYGLPILLVCQKSKIDDWISHFRQYYGLTPFNLTLKRQYEEFFGTVGLFVGIINYDLIFRREELRSLKNFTLVLDESSCIQNETAKRSKFILKMQPQNVVLLSGTPTAGKYEKFLFWKGTMKPILKP